MHQHIPHILAAAHQLHQTARYYPMTSHDKKSLAEAGGVAGAVIGLGLITRLRGRTPATSK